jgi:hypothetical protein
LCSCACGPFSSEISNTDATTDPEIPDILFRIDQGTNLDTLAKHIEQQMEKREFCVVFDDEIERCWSSKKLRGTDRHREIQAFAESRGWSGSIHDSESDRPRAVFQQ